jgi:hypothetical protein
MPITLVVGGRGGRSQFNEWRGPEQTDPSLSSFARDPKNPVPELSTDTVTVSYVSNNTAVATVDSSGNVTAVAPGSAVITATASNGLMAKDTVTVVTQQPNVAATLTLINN